jgi:hypothetical protein
MAFRRPQSSGTDVTPFESGSPDDALARRVSINLGE